MCLCLCYVIVDGVMDGLRARADEDKDGEKGKRETGKDKGRKWEERKVKRI